jgi:hypothetical protein
MRTRTLSDPTVYKAGNANYRRYDPGLVENVNYPTPSVTDPAIPSTSVMTDELVKHKDEGYCKHDKREWQLFGFPTVYQVRVNAGIPSNLHTMDIIGDFLPYTYLRTRTSILNPVVGSSTFDWSRFSYYALKAMKPKFSDMSLANDILELGQIKDILKPFGQKLKNIKKSIRGKASNATLWYMFGIKPLVEDIEGIAELIRTLPAKIAAIRKRASRLQTRHYACPSGQQIALPADPASFAVIENSGTFREVGIKALYRWINEPEYHATLKFRYDVSSLSDLELSIQAWAQAMGIDKPLSVVWNAIPFSFVVDWFVDVGDWIDSLQAEPVLPIVIESFSHSLKYSYRADALLSYWQGLYIGTIGHGTTSYYERKKDIPSTVAPLNIKFPNLTQVVLGLALLGQAHENARNRKHAPTRRPPRLPWLKFSSSIPSNQIR